MHATQVQNLRSALLAGDDIGIAQDVGVRHLLWGHSALSPMWQTKLGWDPGAGHLEQGVVVCFVICLPEARVGGVVPQSAEDIPRSRPHNRQR